MTALLTGEGVCKYFGGLKAVDEVDFQLHEGEILGLIGPNGAGKTTLFAVVAGSIPATRGVVRLGDRAVTRYAAHRSVHLGIARTHQIVRPFARLTVLENVLVGHYYGRPQGVTGAARDRALEILEFSGLGGQDHRLPGELTLAGRKRLEIARALATGPRVLLLDEVVAGLNPVEGQRLVQTIREIRDRGVSIIMIEHVMPAVMSLSDRVMVLDYGRAIAEGRPDDVANDPKVIEAYLGREDNGSASSADTADAAADPSSTSDTTAAAESAATSPPDRPADPPPDDPGHRPPDGPSDRPVDRSEER